MNSEENMKSKTKRVRRLLLEAEASNYKPSFREYGIRFSFQQYERAIMHSFFAKHQKRTTIPSLGSIKLCRKCSIQVERTKDYTMRQLTVSKRKMVRNAETLLKLKTVGKIPLVEAPSSLNAQKQESLTKIRSFGYWLRELRGNSNQANEIAHNQSVDPKLKEEYSKFKKQKVEQKKVLPNIISLQRKNSILLALDKISSFFRNNIKNRDPNIKAAACDSRGRLESEHYANLSEGSLTDEDSCL